MHTYAALDAGERSLDSDAAARTCFNLLTWPAHMKVALWVLLHRRKGHRSLATKYRPETLLGHSD